MRYFMQLSYVGTAYHGWQSQKNAPSVQKAIETRISTLLNEKICLTGAGRTDTGVHAHYYIAHFDSDNDVVLSDDFLFRINFFLPTDIAIQKIVPVGPKAHSRFDAVSRTYHYKISLQKNPFVEDFSYFRFGSLDLESMNKAAAILMEFDDFLSFCKKGSDNKTTICKISHCTWVQKSGHLVFEITADRFLRNMVRSIVATMVSIGDGKTTLDEFRLLLIEKRRPKAGFAVPAKGLFLTDIQYPESVYQATSLC